MTRTDADQRPAHRAGRAAAPAVLATVLGLATAGHAAAAPVPFSRTVAAALPSNCSLDAATLTVTCTLLLVQADLGIADVDNLAVKLTLALEGPLLMALAGPAMRTTRSVGSLQDSWQTLIERLCSPGPGITRSADGR